MSRKVRVGPRMAAADYVRRHPGTAIHSVAKVVGPNGSVKYGYQIVHRAMRAGLISGELKADGRWILTPPTPPTPESEKGA